MPSWACTVTRVLELDEHTLSAIEYGGGWMVPRGAQATVRRHAEEAYAEYVNTPRSARIAAAQRQYGVGVRKEKRARDNDKAQRDFRINVRAQTRRRCASARRRSNA